MKNLSLLLFLFFSLSCGKEDSEVIFKPTFPEDHTKDPYYPANNNGGFVETDFFTAERTADNRRLKFVVQPNTTGKERTYTVILEAGNSGGRFNLTQTAD